MTDDKIAEIRERHARDAEWSGGWAQICPRTHDDRATLLTEVERLRASNERLHRALFRIAGKAPFADDPWTIARKAMKREAKP